MEATLRLFRTVKIKSKRKKKPSKELLAKTIKYGFILSPVIVYNYSEKELDIIVEKIIKEIGLSPEQMNSSFHKSWQKVKEAEIEQLILEQIIHYITTYGFERLGIYNQDSVYIPNEELSIPISTEKNIKLIVIKGYTVQELHDKLIEFLGSGIALKEDTIKDVIDVALSVNLTDQEINAIKNKEVKTALYDYLGMFPENATEFLRYIIYKSIGKTLLIKNRETIEEITTQKNLDVLRLVMKYEQHYGLKKLAEIFYRFKPLFLAFKTNPKLNSYINKIRKLARKYHKPMKVDYLNDITRIIKNRIFLDNTKFDRELDKTNIFRKIRLAYALKFRTQDVDSILYRIRNGKGYATDFSFKYPDYAQTVLNIVIDSIVKDVSKNVKGKKIYIPEYITYALPATEKQFTGYFPSGTYVSMPEDMVAGIHWKNVKTNRIDLDLSLLSPEIGKIGWDASYRTEDRKILFSGDVTDAHRKGASEFFYVEKQIAKDFIMFVNYYNYDVNIEVPFKIMVAKEKVYNLKQNYIVDPNNILAIAESKINQKQKILGLLTAAENESRFYFAETYIGMSITSSYSEFANHARKYLVNFYKNSINLNDILSMAGGIMCVNKDQKYDIDLSPENLEKDTMIKLLKEKI